MHVYHLYFLYFLPCLLNLFNVFFLCDVSHMRMPDGYNKAITYLLTFHVSYQTCHFSSLLLYMKLLIV